MKVIFTISIFLSFLFLFGQGSLVGKLFGERKRAELHPLKDLIDAKNHAYIVWFEAQRAIPDVSHSSWNKMYNAYEDAWSKYVDSKKKVEDSVHSLMDPLLKDYNEAKVELKESTEKLKEYLDKYKDKTEDRLKEEFFHGLDALVDTATAARKKYTKAKDTLSNYYDEFHDEVVLDYQAVAQFLSESMDRVNKYTKKPARDQKIEEQLHKTQNKAKDAFSAVRSMYRSLKGEINLFNTELSEYASSWYNWVKEHAGWAADWLISYKGDTKSKTDKMYTRFQRNIQKLSDHLATEVQEAELGIEQLKERTAKFTRDAFDAIRQKFVNLKDEL